MLSELSGKRILVSGGSGFLGSHLLPQLIASGATVSCLVRSAASASRLPAGVIAVHADCGDREAVAAQARGKDIIIHMAGLLFGARWSDYLGANVAYARNIALAAKSEDGPGRVVFVSSLAAAGPCAAEPGRKETDAVAPVSAYGWSKLAAEQILRAEVGERLAILRPPVIYGSGDRALLPLFRSCARGVGLTDDFPFSLIHAADAARAIILAAASDAPGLWHLSDGKAYAMRELCAEAGRNFGRERIRLARVPSWLLAASAAMGTGINILKAATKSRGRPLAWNWDKYREVRQCGWLADSSQIRKDLGFEPAYDLRQGVEETVSGYKKAGWL